VAASSLSSSQQKRGQQGAQTKCTGDRTGTVHFSAAEANRTIRFPVWEGACLSSQLQSFAVFRSLRFATRQGIKPTQRVKLALLQGGCVRKCPATLCVCGGCPAILCVLPALSSGMLSYTFNVRLPLSFCSCCYILVPTRHSVLMGLFSNVKNIYVT